MEKDCGKWKEIFKAEGYCLPKRLYKDNCPIWWGYGARLLRMTNIWSKREDIRFKKKKELYRKVRIIVLEEMK